MESDTERFPSMTTDKKRQRAGADVLAAANEDKGKAPAAKAKGKNAVTVGRSAAHAAAANSDDNDDASSSDITSSSSSAYSSDTSGNDDSDDDSSDEEEGGEKKKTGKEINVDFEFYDPKPIDFLGLKVLLGTWLDGLEFDGSGLCDALIAQRTVGTVLKTEEAGDPIGVLSCLDARRSSEKRASEEEREGEGEEKRHVPALAQLERYLVSCAPSPADAEKVRAAFAAGSEKGDKGDKGERGGEKHTGVVVSERLLNVPPAVAQPLHEALFDEIEWATEDEPSAALRESFGFGQYLVFSRVYLDDGKRGEEEEEEDESEDEDGKKKKNNNNDNKRARATAAAPAPASAPASSPVVVFARPEDQFFSEVAAWSFVFEPPALPEASDRHRQPQRRGELRRARFVALVDASRVGEVRDKLREALGRAA